MSKYCYVCGKPLTSSENYFCFGPNTYTCANDKCEEFAFWDTYAAKCVINEYHHYVVADHILYTIEPEQTTEAPITILFDDGKIIKTNNLHYKAAVPSQWYAKIPNNAKIKGEI